MLAQHVASELRMHMWTSRSRTDRNTPSRLKIDFWLFKYNGFFYNGHITDFYDLAAPPIFLGEIAPFVVLARGILLGVFRVGKAENEVKIL